MHFGASSLDYHPCIAVMPSHVPSLHLSSSEVLITVIIQGKFHQEVFFWGMYLSMDCFKVILNRFKFSSKDHLYISSQRGTCHQIHSYPFSHLQYSPSFTDRWRCKVLPVLLEKFTSYVMAQWPLIPGWEVFWDIIIPLDLKRDRPK